MIEIWKIFYNKKTGENYGGYTIAGTFTGEEEATKALFAEERGISPDDIGTRIERRKIA